MQTSATFVMKDSSFLVPLAQTLKAYPMVIPTTLRPRPYAHDRVGDPCWYEKYDRTTKESTFREAYLRGWSTSSADGDTYPVAVIEDATTGRINEVYVGDVTFNIIKPEKP